MSEGHADAFTQYALALEYRRENLLDKALEQFTSLRAKEPAYLPMYLMAGQLLLEMEREEDARGWLEQGIEFARSQGNAKALGELQEALTSL